MAFNPGHCGACGFTEDLHEHHIVPRGQDGLNLPTVWLCIPCHAAVHNRSWDPDHGILVRAGIAKSRAKDPTKWTGRRPDLANWARVKELKSGGMGPAAIAKHLGIARSSVYRMLDAS
jgi:hypothetical protein